jgi:hypothetical protein
MMFFNAPSQRLILDLFSFVDKWMSHLSFQNVSRL